MTAAAHVRPIRPGEHAEVVAVSARAFWHDPLFDFFTRDLLHEYELLPHLFRAYLKDLAAPGAELWVAEHDSRPRGFAGWLPPGAFPRTAAQELLRAARTLPVIARASRRRQAIRLLREVDARHLGEPHWYLAVLATDPSLQGRGIGSATLAPVLRRCDEEGTVAYCETQKRDNVSWYARFGFAVAETIELPGIPPVWCLRREPAPARERAR